MSRNYLISTIIMLFVLSSALSVWAEEGMWTLDSLPLKYLQETYGFSPDKEWILHVQMASVRFNDGGSGSFVTPTGLILTNHHVAVGQLQKMSTEEKDYVADGFYAKTMQDEMKCPDLELNELVSMENITDKINGAIKGLTGKEAIKARKKEMARLEKEKMEKTGLRYDTVTLYYGGEYWLYGYKRFRDIRLVMAPEKAIAFYGGDSDNFTYPRYDIDFAIFRAYENGRPVTPTHYFRINPGGAGEGELVFVSGHPGDTKRHLTMSQYVFNRDHLYPDRIAQLKGGIDTLKAYSAKGPEERRRAATLVFGYENSYKCFAEEYKGLRNPVLFAQLETQEKALKTRVEEDPELRKEVGSAWDDIEKTYEKYEKKYDTLTFRMLKGIKLPELAYQIVFYVKETKKPDGERLKGYHDSELDTWNYVNLSPAPLYKDMEALMFAYFMDLSKDRLGESDEFIKILLDGKSSASRAKELIVGTKLTDPEYRKALIKGGEDALRGSEDPLIQLALKLEPYLRENIEWREAHIESVVTPSSEKINRARFKVYGKTKHPDATFTLRLAFGTVRGYPMNGTVAPPLTTFYGLYDHYYGFSGKSDWNLPGRYLEGKERLELSTPVNFVANADIAGGNSGSPVINRNAELVGLIFDGNIESCIGRFVFWEDSNRAVSVHSGAIIEVLQKLYDAGRLAGELLGK